MHPRISLVRWFMLAIAAILGASCGNFATDRPPGLATPSGLEETLVPIPFSTPTATDAQHQLISTENASDLWLLARLGRGDIQQLVWGPDDRTLLVVSTLGIWRYTPPFETPPYLLEGYAAPLAVSPTGEVVASMARGCIQVWDVRTPADSMALECDSRTAPIRLVFDPDGKNLAALYRGGVVRRWEVETAIEKDIIKSDAALLDIVFRRDGALLGLVRDDLGLRVLNLDSGQSVADLSGHSQPPVSAFFSPGGTTVISLASPPDFGLWFWDSLTGKTRFVLQTMPNVSFSSDSTLLAAETLSPGVIQLVDGSTGHLLQELRPEGPGRLLNSMALNAGKTLLAVADSDGSLKIWDLNSQELAELDDGFGSVSGVAWLDEATIAAGYRTGEIQVWDWASGELLSVLEMEPRTEVTGVMTLSPGSPAQLAAGYGDGGVRIWELPSGQRIGSLPWFTPADRVHDLAFERQKGYVAYSVSFFDSRYTTQENAVRVLELSSRTTLVDIRDLHEPASGIAFSPDGAQMAFAAGNMVSIWDVPGKTNLASFKTAEETATALTFSPDGTRLAAGTSDGAVRLWDVETQREIAILRGHERAVTRIAYSPDGMLLASAGGDGTVRLWDTQTWQELTTLEHIGAVSSLAFSEAGHLLLSGTEGGLIYIWGLPAK